MVGHAGSPTCIVYADMTLSRSKVMVVRLLAITWLQTLRNVDITWI